MSKLRVLVVDDHPMVRRGTCEILTDDPEIEVVGQGANGLEALSETERLQPDVVLMDLSMPLMDGVEATQQLRARDPKLGIVILSAHDEDDHVLKALQAGANGYLLKTSAEDLIRQAVKLAAIGHAAILQPEISRIVLGSLKPPPATTLAEPLSDREIDVLKEVAKDLGNKQIASKLSISDRTVQHHLSNIYGKLNVTSRTGAVLKALQERLISLEDVRF
ncbi:Response regulator protein VraR [compost metagenome]